MTWTLCADEMPPAELRVLCVTRRHGVKILLLSPPHSEYKRQTDWQGEGVNSTLQRFRLEDVTHWMPLPDAPECHEPAATNSTHRN